jgi:uncharacterized protein YegP (UPF0339 family)
MITINKSTAKKTLGQFFVTVYAKNGEVLQSSECVKTKASALKNIKATAGVYNNEAKYPLVVIDLTGKKEKEIVI